MFHRDCHDMNLEDIFKTFSKFEQDLKQIYVTYKKYSDRQLADVEDLVEWRDLISIVTDDQQYRMSLFLDNKVVPEEEKGEVCIFLLFVYKIYFIYFF